jgi:hypothetical protein
MNQWLLVDDLLLISRNFPGKKEPPFFGPFPEILPKDAEKLGHFHYQ